MRHAALVVAIMAVIPVAAAGCKGCGGGGGTGGQAQEGDAMAGGTVDAGAAAAVPVVKSQFAAWERVEAQLAKIARVPLAWDKALVAGDEGERTALREAIAAATVMDELFLGQVDVRAPQVKADLEKTDDPKRDVMLRYFTINFGPFDRLDHNRPFINVPPKAPGATFYPLNMTKEEFEGWVANHPKDKAAFTGNFTVIRRDERGGLAAVPYAQAYEEGLARAAAHLAKAAAATGCASLRKYLLSRAAAFSSNDYYASDVDWMDVKDNLVDVTIGPYETYEDELFGYKASFEAFVGLRDPKASADLAKIKAWLGEMRAALPMAPGAPRDKGGKEAPISVIDVVYTAGDARAGINSIAFNLPNDERVRKAKGSKNVLLRNIITAKGEAILAPIGRVVVDPAQQGLVSQEQFFNHTLLHELSHGMGPGFIEKGGKKTEVRVELKELYSTIEEAKADVLGMTGGLFLVGKGFYPPEAGKKIWVTFLANIFRSVRFGLNESHGRANAIILNWMLEQGGYAQDAASGAYRVDFDKAAAAAEGLARRLLEIEAAGDYQGAADLIAKYGALAAPQQATLAKLEGVPVDVQLVFDLDF